MNEIKRKKIKRAAISWLCVAALAAASIPTELTGIITPISVWAEDNTASAVTLGTIDLSRLMEYKSNSSLCPTGVTAELEGNDSNEYDRYVVLTFSQNGTYKLVGSNYINGSYVDVQIRAANNAEVNIVCDDAYIKNDRGSLVNDGCGYEPRDYTIPLKAESGSKLNVSGKLYIDTFDDSFFYDVYGDVTLSSFYVDLWFYSANSDYEFIDKIYALSGYDYDLRDYISGYKCFSVYNKLGSQETVNSDATLDIYAEHNYDSSNTCTRCGVGMHTVTIKNGSDAQTVSVKDKDKLTRPTDPVNGSNAFTGWYTDEACTKLYDFTKPVTEDIIIYAGWFTPVVFDGVTYDKPLNKNTIKIFYTDASGKVSFDTGNYVLAGDITSDDILALNAGSNVKLFLNGFTLASGLDTASAAGFAIANDNTNPGQLLTKNTKADNWTLPTDFVIAENDDTATNAKYPYALRHIYVDFELNGHGTPIASAETQNNAVAKPANPEASGWTFGGWYSDTALTLPFDFDNITDICTAYAKWTEYAIDSIAVKTKPEKTDYIEGESFDPAGLVLTVTYDNGETKDVTYTAANASEFAFSPDGELALTDKSVTVTYGGKTAVQTISVRDKAVTSVSVATAPDKTSYTAGERFDPTGLVLTVTYDNGKTENIAYTSANASEFAFSPDNALALGDNSVTVTYGGKNVTVAVTVNKGKITVKPSTGDVGGAVIDMPTDDLFAAVIDDEDKRLIEQGVDIGVYMAMVTIDPEYVSEADKIAINSVLGDFSVGCYLDVNLFKMYSNGIPEKQVTEPAGGVYVSFNVPPYIINNYPEDEYVYSMFCSHNGGGYSVMSTYDAEADKMTFYSDKFSVYALGVKAKQPTPTVLPAKHSVSTDIHAAAANTAAAGEKVTVNVESGYKATVTDRNGKVIAVLTGTGTFVMPDSDVKIVSSIDEMLYAMLASGIENSYVFSYDPDMELIKTSSTRKKNDYIIIDLGEEYSGRSFTVYKGRRSTNTKVTNGVLDAKGRFRFEDAGYGKNYTLVIDE